MNNPYTLCRIQGLSYLKETSIFYVFQYINKHWFMPLNKHRKETQHSWRKGGFRVRKVLLFFSQVTFLDSQFFIYKTGLITISTTTTVTILSIVIILTHNPQQCYDMLGVTYLPHITDADWSPVKTLYQNCLFSLDFGHSTLSSLEPYSGLFLNHCII